MMAAIREYDWTFELGLHVGPLVGIVVVVLVAGGLLFLVKSLLKTWRHG